MSFTLASQSVIRFESSTARLGDEWQRTLMFFNVDISGGVHCDHPNEITAPRIQERNGKRELINEICKASTHSYSNTFPERNPGGGLSNPIRECAMPFGKPYEFRAQSRDDFDRRGSRPRRRSLGGRRRNSLFSDSRRHLQYRSAKPRWNLIDTAPFTHFPTQNSAHRYVAPDYESDNGYSNRCKHKSYQSEEFELPSQISRDLTYSEDARESRDRYNTESYTDSSYESPPDYYPMERPKRESYQRPYEPPPYRNRSSYYSEERFSNDFNPNGRDSLPQLNMFRPRGKQRQASGSILPEHNVDYSDIYQYSNEHKDYKIKESYDRYQESKDSDYEDRYEDQQPPPELGNKVRYSSKKRFGYEDYGETRVRPPPLTNPKPKAKYRSECRTPYKYRDKGYSISQPRNYKTDAERYKNTEGPGKLSRQLHEPRHRAVEPCPTESGIYHRNRSRRHSRLEKVLQYCTPFKKAREASAQYNRISKQILGLGLPKMNENNPKATGTVPRRKFNFTVEEIPQPYKKYLKKEASRSNHHILFNDEIPRRQRNLTRELSVNFGNTSTSKIFDQQEGKSKQNFSSDKKKLFDFGAEIPYRFWKSAAPSSMLFVDDIPFRKKERMRYSSANIKSDSNSDLGIAYSISAARLRRDPTKKRVSLYEVRNHRQPKSIKQKISGFLKMSKKNHKRSSSFKDKMKKIKTERQDDQEEEDNLIRGKSKTRFVPDSPKLKPKSKTKAKSQSKSESRSTSATRGSKTSKQEKTPEQKQSDLTKPSLTNKTYRCLSKIGTGGHYPTVFRGKNVNEENETACNFLCSMRNSKSNHSDRISSGNCSLNNYVTKPEPILIDEKNVCANCAGTASLSENLTIVPSQENGDQCCNNELIKPEAEPQAEAQAEDQAEAEAETESESSCESIPISMQISINENQFKNVRFSPVPSICQSPSSSSDSSQNSSNEGLVCSRTTLINRQNIETCSKPPEIMQSTSSEEGCTCPRRRLCANWSLTRKSCCSHNSNHNTLECNRCRPARPGLCLPNNIEMSSSPPVVVHELNKKSSLKGPNTKPEGTSNRRVCLKVNSSSSETVITGKCKSQTTQNQGTCSNGEDNTEKCKSQTTQNQGTCSNGEDRNPEKKATPCPTENPTSPQPQNASSCCVPKEPFELPAATMSECSRNSTQTNSKCSMDNMQLVCLPNSSYAPCSTCPNYGNRNFIPTYRPSNLSNITCNDCPDTVHKRDLISGWAEENACGKNIVEELKRELMNTFRKEREIESQCSRMRQPQHIMFFPCPPHPMMRPNTFYTPDSVVCWAACSKPPPPF
ncbi:hypothetical protein KR054_009454 [Drosophila jambulina]|nr:hypothetical protein KR054_009454 [Drosophila jambulina]